MADVLPRTFDEKEWDEDFKAPLLSTPPTPPPPPPPYAKAFTKSHSASIDGGSASPRSELIFSFDESDISTLNSADCSDDDGDEDTSLSENISYSDDDDEGLSESPTRLPSSEWNSGLSRRKPPPRLNLETCQVFQLFSTPIYHFSPRHQCYADTGVTVPFGPTPLISPQTEYLSPSDLESGYAAPSPVVSPYIEEPEARPVLRPYYDAYSAHALRRADMRARVRMAVALFYTLAAVSLFLMAWQVWGVEIPLRLAAANAHSKIEAVAGKVGTKVGAKFGESSHLLREELRYHMWQLQGVLSS